MGLVQPPEKLNDSARPIFGPIPWVFKNNFAMQKLECAVQSYDWGIVAPKGYVTKCSKHPEEGKPYAELWMGTHPSGPSKLQSGEKLSEWLEKHPEAMGSLSDKSQLPFLFKVLSASKALSIQAHPDKKLAEQLHAARPDVYKDDNHKPEMIIALGEFEAMCGFREIGVIASFMKTVPELREILCEKGQAGADYEAGKCASTEDALRSLFTCFVMSDEDYVRSMVEKMVARVSAIPEGERSLEDRLVLRLNSQFPSDTGIFCVFFLNVFHLSPGDALFLGPNIPHSYISGDGIECMATSDNVVRAGLTPKLKDKDTLCSMLIYDDKKPMVMKGDAGSAPGLKEYVPPVDAFRVTSIKLDKGVESKLVAISYPSIVVVTDGAINIKDQGINAPGDVIFIPANTEVSLAGGNEGGLAFRATCNM